MFISSLWDVKEPTLYSRRVGDEFPGVVAVLCEYMGGWVGIAGPNQLNSCQNFNLLKQNHKQITNRELAYGTRKTIGPHNQYGNFKSMLLFFSLYSLLSMVERRWLKISRKRKFKELETANEEQALLEKSVPKSTRYVTKWSFNIYAQ